MILSQAASSLWRSLTLIRARTLIDSETMTSLVERLFRARLGFFQTHAAGDLVARVNSYVAVRQILADSALTTLLDGGIVLIYLAVMASVSWRLVLVAAVFVVLNGAIIVATSRSQARMASANAAAASSQLSFLVEVVGGIHQIKAAGAEAVIAEKWRQLLIRQLNVENRHNYFNARFAAVFNSCQCAGPLAVLWYGTREVMDGRITAGAMVMASSLAVTMFGPFSRCIAAFIQVQGVVASVHRLDSIVTAPEERASKPRSGGGTRITGAIRVASATHRHLGCSRRTLDDVSFELDAGQTIAIVGATGAGKSTLVDVLLGLEPLESGEVTYDGATIDEIGAVHLRRQVGVVLQDTWLFRGTVRENICVGAPHARSPQLVRAARRASIHEEIASMPLGYETPLSDGGANLSGGQRQRVALARALLLEPRVLILDEATSHLDNATERRIDETIRSLRCTRIIIAHRLSTVETADQILVLDGGRIVERGTHRELLAHGGRYRNLMARRSEPDVETEARAGGNYEPPPASNLEFEESLQERG